MLLPVVIASMYKQRDVDQERFYMSFVILSMNNLLRIEKMDQIKFNKTNYD